MRGIRGTGGVREERGRDGNSHIFVKKNLKKLQFRLKRKWEKKNP